MYVPINPLGYSCIKKLQRDNLLHAYNDPHCEILKTKVAQREAVSVPLLVKIHA